MSYTIAKSLNTVKGEDGLWHVKGVTCSNNVYPHWYRPFCGEGEASREKLDGELVYDHYQGNIKSSTRYNVFVDEMYYGVTTCAAWESLMKVMRLHDKAFHKALEHINDPEGSAEKVRWGKVEARIDRWIRDVHIALGRAYRAWTPSKAKFYVRIPEGYVSTVSKYKFKYTPIQYGRTIRARVFTAAGAAKFCKDFRSYNPTREVVEAAA